ncbi:MAG: hypothetical protein ACLFPQ_04640 [Candidatus Woesearchaeota archaeon]
MEPKLIEYINRQLANGFTIDKIREAMFEYYPKNLVDEHVNYVIEQHVENIKSSAKILLSQGKDLSEIKDICLEREHDNTIVDKLLSELKDEKKGFQNKSQNDISSKNDTNNKKGQTQYVQKQLEIYIQDQLRKGYSLESIHSLLLNQGYNPENVNFEINKIRQSHLYVHKSHFLTGIIVMLLIAGLGFGSFMLFGDSQRLLDVKAEGFDTMRTLSPGERIEFKVEALNLGKRERYDVDFTFTMRDMDGNVLERKSDTRAIATSISLIPFMDIPSDAAPGNHMMLVEADYGDGVARSSFQFRIENNYDSEYEDFPDDRDDSDLEDNKQDTDDSYEHPDDSADDNSNIKDDTYTDDETSDENSENEYIPPEKLFIFIPSEDGATSKSSIESIARDDITRAKELCSNLPNPDRQNCLTKVQEALGEFEEVCENTSTYLGETFCLDETSEDIPENPCKLIEGHDERIACEEFLKESWDNAPINSTGEGIINHGSDEIRDISDIID